MHQSAVTIGVRNELQDLRGWRLGIEGGSQRNR